jgi:hypothetical protein
VNIRGIVKQLEWSEINEVEIGIICSSNEIDEITGAYIELAKWPPYRRWNFEEKKWNPKNPIDVDIRMSDGEYPYSIGEVVTVTEGKELAQKYIENMIRNLILEKSK